MSNNIEAKVVVILIARRGHAFAVATDVT